MEREAGGLMLWEDTPEHSEAKTATYREDLRGGSGQTEHLQGGGHGEEGERGRSLETHRGDTAGTVRGG